jgi:cell division protein FtsN
MNLSIASAEVKGQTYYRVRAAGFSSKLDASMASKWAAQALNAGPFWIGKDSEKKQSAMSKPKTSSKARVANNAPSARVTAPVRAPLAKQPVQLRSLPMRDNWFVFVDTYDSGQRADEVISMLNGQGLDAKVAVESRSGELFYRVQIVGIENEKTGNTIVSQLRADAFKNARLRKTVN